jgi:serine/threonine protein kinase
MAPELLKGDYDAKADIWSIGVITFSLLSSSLPFYGEDRLTVMKKILRGKFRFSSKRWAGISMEARNLVQSLLTMNPTTRPTGLEALDSPWLQDYAGTNKPFTKEEMEQMDIIQASIQKFASYPTLKKLALMIVEAEQVKKLAFYVICLVSMI